MNKLEISLLSNHDTIASLPKLSSWSFLWINSQNTKPPLTISLASPCGVHPNLQKIQKQCKAKGKVITCHNVILVLEPIHQPIHNFVPNCMFNILMTYTTIHFHFLHKLGFCISQATNLHSILASTPMTIYNDKTKKKGTLWECYTWIGTLHSLCCLVLSMGKFSL
jgi:hypothetical protein